MKQATAGMAGLKGLRVPEDRKTPPRGEFIYNGSGGCDFVQARRWLWQYQPTLGRWVVIDG